MSDHKVSQDDFDILSFFFFFARGSRKPLGSLRNYMAIINSVVVGRGQKSVGEVSLQVRRGRTIAARRITENKSNSPGQALQRSSFGSFTKIFSKYKFFFSENFETTKYGSKFNQFVHQNRGLIGTEGYDRSLANRLTNDISGLMELLDQIINGNLMEPAFVSYGSLVGTVSSRGTPAGKAVEGVVFNLIPADLKGIKLRIDWVGGGGYYASGYIDLYNGGDYPDMSWDDNTQGGTGEITATTNTNTGQVTIDVAGKAAADWVAAENGITLSSTYAGYVLATVYQNGKILSSPYILQGSIGVGG